MDYNLLSGIGSYLMPGGNGTNSYLSSPYLSGVSSYLTNPYLSGLYSSSLTSQAGVSGIFQSGVRFGQELEKAKANNPESAEELQKILDEAFGSKSSGKTAGTGKTQAGSAAVVYEPSWERTGRSREDLQSYLAGRRASRIQQRQSSRQH